MEYLLKISYALGLAAVTLGSAWLWGRTLFSKLVGDGWTGEEKNILSVGLGLGLISYSFLFLSLLGLLYDWLVFPLLALPVLWLKRFKPPSTGCLPLRRLLPAFFRPHYILAAVLLPVFLLNLVCSFTPPYAGDAIGYHLPAVRAYLQNHKLIWLEGNVLANQPAAFDMLYVIGFAGGSEFFPQLLHCLIGLLLVFSVFAGGRRYFGPRPALLATVIFYTVPTVSRISSWAYIDLGLSFWVLWAILMFLRWRENGSVRFLTLAALFSGLAMGSKYTGITFFALLWLLAGADCLRSAGRAKSCGRLVLCGFLALAAASPWYLKNLILTGNPVFPFLFSVFGGKGWDAGRAAGYQAILLNYGMGKRLIDYLLLPWNLTVKAGYSYQTFDGKIGPAFLVFLPLMLFSGKKTFSFRFLGIYSALYFVIWAALSQQIRMLIPILPLVSLLVGAIVFSLWDKNTGVLKVVLVLTLGFVLRTNLFAIRDNAKLVSPQKVISGRETKDAFLSRVLYNYPAVKYINTNLSPDSRILFVYGGNGWYYCERDTVVDSIFQEHTLKRLLLGSDSPQELSDSLKAEGISHLLINLELARLGLAPSLDPGKLRQWRQFRQSRVKVLYGDGSNFLLEVI